ncbi:MAG: 6,7-dimethyl-8-ribityllumazine synthase [Rhodobacterales bacterium]|nr:6,7-dimethyl-8-ribityllumazine synthase [Rhodobacterales bacterium]
MNGSKRVLIVEARFYEDIADGLYEGVVAELEKAGVAHDRITVPGVFEIPTAVRMAMRAQETQAGPTLYDGVITTGCVIRGETDHYDHICREASRALMELSVTYCFPHGFGVLTCESYAQAKVRADVAQKNKGADAAHACLRLMELRESFGLRPL